MSTAVPRAGPPAAVPPGTTVASSSPLRTYPGRGGAANTDLTGMLPMILPDRVRTRIGLRRSPETRGLGRLIGVGTVPMIRLTASSHARPALNRHGSQDTSQARSSRSASARRTTAGRPFILRPGLPGFRRSPPTSTPAAQESCTRGSRRPSPAGGTREPARFLARPHPRSTPAAQESCPRGSRRTAAVTAVDSGATARPEGRPGRRAGQSFNSRLTRRVQVR